MRSPPSIGAPRDRLKFTGGKTGLTISRVHALGLVVRNYREAAMAQLMKEYRTVLYGRVECKAGTAEADKLLGAIRGK